MHRRIAIGILILGVSGSVWAQTSVRGGTQTRGRDALIAEIEKARARLGPFYALTRIDVGEIGYQYTEDLLVLADTGKPSGKPNDFMLSVGLPAKLFFVPAKTFAASVAMSPTYRWYAESKENRGLNYFLRGDTYFMFNKFYVDLYGSTADQRVRDRSELSELVTRDSLAFGGLAELFVTSRTSLGASARLNDVEYPASSDQPAGTDLERLKRRETTVSMALRHEFTRSTRGGLEAEISTYDFDTKELSSDQQTVYLVLARNRSQHQLSLRLGYAELNYDDPQLKDDNGFLGRLEWSTQTLRRVNLISSFSRSLEFSTYGENGHYVSDRLGVKGVMPLGRRLELDALAQVGNNAYPADMLRPGTGLQKRKDDTQTFGGGFLFHFTDWFGLGFGVTSWDRNSNFDEFDEDGVEYSLRLSLGI